MEKSSVRTIVKFKDGQYANLDADLIYHDIGGVIQLWKENSLVAIFNLSDIIGIYLSQKGGTSVGG